MIPRITDNRGQVTLALVSSANCGVLQCLGISLGRIRFLEFR